MRTFGTSAPLVGLGFRKPLRPLFFDGPSAPAHDRPECAEIVSESYLHHDARAWVVELAEHYPVLPHGVELSVGSARRADPEYLLGLRELARLADAPFVTDHLALTRSEDHDLNHLSPLWKTDQALKIVVENVERAQDAIGRPLALETITRPFEFARAEYSEAEFISEVVARTGCGILLDITNVFINGRNLGFDPESFIESLPAAAVWQYHLVGYSVDADGRLADLHALPIQEEIWQLYEFALRRAPATYVVLERDTNFPRDPAELVRELERARSIARRVVQDA